MFSYDLYIKSYLRLKFLDFLLFLLNPGFQVNTAKIAKNPKISITNNFLCRGRMKTPTIWKSIYFSWRFQKCYKVAFSNHRNTKMRFYQQPRKIWTHGFVLLKSIILKYFQSQDKWFLSKSSPSIRGFVLPYKKKILLKSWLSKDSSGPLNFSFFAYSSHCEPNCFRK